MSDRQPFQYIEIDTDYCSNTYGSAPCTAVLGTTGERKCFNMYRHCQDQANFVHEVKTVRFCEGVSGIPVGQHFFPCLERVSKQSSSVNIGGMDPKLSAFGRRAKLEFTCHDFPDHDRFLDKYQAERISGAAQASAIGYNPEDVGTFFGKLKQRWPYYSGRPVRLVEAYLDGGVITVVKTRHFILQNFKRDRNDRVTFTAYDPLDLANNKRAVAPKPVNGVLADDLTIGASTATLSPAGIGDSDYPASGFVLIGSEYIEFMRVADDLTFINRAVSGTTESSHSAGDSVQVGLSYRNARLDTVINDLMVNFADLDPAFIPTATWAAEVTRWAPNVVITTDIVKPTGVSKLIGEIAQLGCSIWWNETAQEVGLKTVRPPDDDPVWELTDDNGIKRIEIDDRDDDRLTEVYFNSVLRDPTLSEKEPRNFERGRYVFDLNSKAANAFGDTRIKEINCRMLNQGSDDLVGQISRDIINRHKLSPVRYWVWLDAKDRDIELTDILLVSTDAIQTPEGTNIPTFMQVLKEEGTEPGHEFRLLCQAYTYDDRFGLIAPDSVTNTYDVATDEEKETYGFIAPDMGNFPDGSQPFVII